MKKNIIFFMILNLAIAVNAFALKPALSKPISAKRPPHVKQKLTTITRPETAPVLSSQKDTLNPGETSLFTWTSIAVADRYDFQRADDPDFTEHTIITEATQTEIDFGGGKIPETKNYYVRVRARNDDGSGPWSNVIKITVIGSSDAAPKPPEAPILSSSTSRVLSDQTYKITWNSVPGAKQYAYNEATSDSFSSYSAVSNGSLIPGNSFQFHHEVTKTTTYYYRVRVTVSGQGQPYSAWSNTVAVTVDPRQ